MDNHIMKKHGLTSLQYYGGPGMTPKDWSVVSNALVAEYGNYSFDACLVSCCTAQWGFRDWAIATNKMKPED